MQVTTTETIDVLNDLVEINNDRIVGYERALKELSSADADLKALFTSMIDESRQIRVDLAGEVQSLGGEFEAGTTTSGKLYRAWMDVKAVFTGSDRYTILSNCEYGEDAAQKAYRDALEEEMPGYIRTTLQAQQQILRKSHDKIKALRDAAK